MLSWNAIVLITCALVTGGESGLSSPVSFEAKRSSWDYSPFPDPLQGISIALQCPAQNLKYTLIIEMEGETVEARCSADYDVDWCSRNQIATHLIATSDAFQFFMKHYNADTAKFTVRNHRYPVHDIQVYFDHGIQRDPDLVDETIRDKSNVTNRPATATETGAPVNAESEWEIESFLEFTDDDDDDDGLFEWLALERLNISTDLESIQ